MKKLQTLCLFILLFLGGFQEMNAQQQDTAYEIKKAELIVQLWSKYGQSLTQLVVNTADRLGDEEFIAYARSISGNGAINWYANELRKAQKLKTSVDFKREKEAKYEKTDMFSIYKNIKTVFEEWNHKGEFEKHADYEERLLNKSQNAFTQICIEQIKRKIDDYNDYNDLNKELQIYNADNEFFTVKFRINSIEWQSKINVPISDAENFKNKWSGLQLVINDYDWCFVENALCPTLITLTDKSSKYQFTLPLQNKVGITYSFDDFGIDNPFLNGFIFKYFDAKTIELKISREKFVKDSLETVSYNDKLEKTFKDYNSQLLVNPYNIEKNVISEYQKILKGEDKEENYKSSLNSLSLDYEGIKKEFEMAFSRAYSNSSQFFPTKEEFEQFYVQGEETLQTEITKRKEKKEEEEILNYLKVNSKFVESLDFKQAKKESVGSAIGRGLLYATLNSNISAKDYTDENKAREDILSLINESSNKSYFILVLDFVFATNKVLNKEWTKNGQYFSNKAELYLAFISGDYKQKLKNKK